MIRLDDAELVSVLPCYLKENEDVQAVSYAYRMGMAKMLAWARISGLLGNPAMIPEEILDLLAVELRSQYYDETMDVETKRDIIRNSLAWYTKGGTASAVNEMVSVIFGGGRIVEWFENGAKPGSFAIETDMELSADSLKKLGEVIDKVKNMKSHLVTVAVRRDIGSPIYLAVHARSIPHVIVRGGGLNNVQEKLYIAVKVVRYGHTVIRQKEAVTDV